MLAGNGRGISGAAGAGLFFVRNNLWRWLARGAERPGQSRSLKYSAADSQSTVSFISTSSTRPGMIGRPMPRQAMGIFWRTHSSVSRHWPSVTIPVTPAACMPVVLFEPQMPVSRAADAGHDDAAGLRVLLDFDRPRAHIRPDAVLSERLVAREDRHRARRR